MTKKLNIINLTPFSSEFRDKLQTDNEKRIAQYLKSLLKTININDINFRFKLTPPLKFFYCAKLLVIVVCINETRLIDKI